MRLSEVALQGGMRVASDEIIHVIEKSLEHVEYPFPIVVCVPCLAEQSQHRGERRANFFKIAAKVTTVSLESRTLHLSRATVKSET